MCQHPGSFNVRAGHQQVVPSVISQTSDPINQDIARKQGPLAFNSIASMITEEMLDVQSCPVPGDTGFAKCQLASCSHVTFVVLFPQSELGRSLGGGKCCATSEPA